MDKVKVSDDDLLVQAYIDGELDAVQLEKVEALLKRDPARRTFVQSAKRVGALAREELRSHAIPGGSSALFDRIDRALDGVESGASAGQTPLQPRLRALEGGARSARSEGTARAAIVGSRRRWVWLAAACAIGGYIAIRSSGAPDLGSETPAVEASRTSPDQRSLTAEDLRMLTSRLRIERGSQVVDVDFGDRTGVVFTVEGDASETTPVVWIQE